MLWPLLGGQLWIIDDHEIILFSHLLKSHGGLSLDSFATALGHTELLGFDSGRYRPVYYTLRVLKSAWFGDNAALWFSFNAAFLYLSLVIAGVCLRRYFGWFWVATGMIALVALPFHAGLWGRLGPSEIDSFLWCALALLGVLWHSEKCRWAWPLFCVATALAIGAKENFILLLIPVGWLLWRDWQQRTLRVSQCVWSILPMLVAIPVGIVLLRSVFISGADIYGVSTQQGALKSIGLFLVASGGAYFSYIILSVLILFRHKIPNREAFQNVLGAWTVIFLVLLGSYVFYRGDVAGLNRYGFPYHALLLLEFFVVLFVLKSPLSQMVTYSDGRSLFVRWSIGTICCLGAVSALIGLSLNTMRVASQVRNTEIFADFLKVARSYQTVGIITTGAALGWTYEPLLSLRRYHDAGHFPEVSYIPIFDKGEGQGLLGMEKSLSVPKIPLRLGPDVLLVEFGPPNKRVYLGSFWQKIAYFTHPWTNPHWFRVIEHSNTVRPMAKVLGDRPLLPLDGRGEAVIDDDITLYVPADYPQSGTLLLQTSASLPPEHCWRATVNGQKTDAYLVPQGVKLAVTAEMWGVARYHPQILTVNLNCSADAGRVRVPLPLSALILDGPAS